MIKINGFSAFVSIAIFLVLLVLAYRMGKVGKFG